LFKDEEEAGMKKAIRQNYLNRRKETKMEVDIAAVNCIILTLDTCFKQDAVKHKVVRIA